MGKIEGDWDVCARTTRGEKRTVGGSKLFYREQGNERQGLWQSPTKSLVHRKQSPLANGHELCGRRQSGHQAERCRKSIHAASHCLNDAQTPSVEAKHRWQTIQCGPESDIP